MNDQDFDAWIMSGAAGALGGEAFLIYCTLLVSAAKHPHLAATVELLAEKTGLDGDRVRQGLAVLEQGGHVRRVEGFVGLPPRAGVF